MKNTSELSNQLESFIAFFKCCEKEYKYYYEEVGKKEKEQIDLLHQLELDCVDYSERCRTATQLRRCLKERRYYKDRVEERSPIAEFLADPTNKNLLDRLARVLGEVRKAERYHANRTYKPRVLNSLSFKPDIK